MQEASVGRSHVVNYSCEKPPAHASCLLAFALKQSTQALVLGLVFWSSKPDETPGISFCLPLHWEEQACFRDSPRLLHMRTRTHTTPHHN